MTEISKDVLAFLSGEKIFPALISAITTVIVFFITLFSKRYFDTRILSSKLETEHKFDQRKRIKEALVKYKVQLLTACEDLNHRLWNFSHNHDKGWINVAGDYKGDHYYFLSTVYRFLCTFAWIKKITKEIIYLDTTIATKEDMDFIKFLRVFPTTFCDMTFIVGQGADGEYAVDHFFRNHFELFSDSVIEENEIISFEVFKNNMGIKGANIEELSRYIDGISPNEERMRWDRLHLLHLTLILF